MTTEQELDAWWDSLTPGEKLIAEHTGNRTIDKRCPPLTGSCEDDCQVRCAYPGQFSECS